MKPDLIDEIITSLQTVLPPLNSHMRLKLKELLDSQGLVTQDSFEVQRQVLLRTREKLKALEARVKDLEGRGIN